MCRPFLHTQSHMHLHCKKSMFASLVIDQSLDLYASFCCIFLQCSTNSFLFSTPTDNTGILAAEDTDLRTSSVGSWAQQSVRKKVVREVSPDGDTLFYLVLSFHARSIGYLCDVSPLRM